MRPEQERGRKAGGNPNYGMDTMTRCDPSPCTAGSSSPSHLPEEKGWDSLWDAREKEFRWHSTCRVFRGESRGGGNKRFGQFREEQVL